MKRVLVCGGRDYADVRHVYRVLDLVGADVVIHGKAPGADTHAGAWARKHNVEERACPAAWGTLGSAAGPIRNASMLDQHDPHLVIAFPGGDGTEDMVKKALAADVPVIRVEARKPKPPETLDLF